MLNNNYDTLPVRLHNFYLKMKNIPAYYEAAKKQIKNPTVEHTQLAIDQNLGGLSVFETDLEDALKKDNPKKEIADAISRSHKAFKQFSKQSFAERGEKLKNLSGLLLKHKNELGTLMAIEMGKPITHGIFEAVKSAECCVYYANNAENLLKPQLYPVGSDCSVHYEPLGSIFSIMPFNFPL